MESSTNESTNPGPESPDSTVSDICLSCRYLSDAHSLPPVSGCPCCELIERARGLFEICLASHSECEMPTSPPLLSRVLDVGEAGNTSEPFLYVPDDASQEQGSYVALSYCWGKDTGSFVMTTNSNIHERRAGIPLSSLPTTLREAVYITRRLNIRYLWIDALCIIQGCEDDWTSNAAKMDEIYGNAVLTIAAASARSCTEGVLKPRLYQHWNVPSMLKIDHEPIYHRAWTLQERLLAHRYLSFGTEHMTWQCQTQTIIHSEFTDYNPSTSALRLYHMMQNFQSPSARWERIITDYTARYLTHENDKLPALSGIAKKIQSHTSDQYLSGLWKNDILQQLCWKVSNIILKPIDFQKPKDYRAPSWSWASIDGNIDFSPGRPPFKAAFVECTVHPLFANDLFGRVKSGTLVLEGPLKQSEVRWKDSYNFGNFPSLVGLDGSFVGNVWPDNEDRKARHEVRAEWREMRPWCLQMTSEASIVLLPVRGHGSYTFRRVGFMYAPVKAWFEGAPRKTVSII